MGSRHVMLTMWTMDRECFADGGAAHICLRMGMSFVESNVLIDTRASWPHPSVLLFQVVRNAYSVSAPDASPSPSLVPLLVVLNQNQVLGRVDVPAKIHV